MPPVRNKSSTIRRKELASFIEEFGDNMVRPCSSCRNAKRVCRVHIRSGKCGECVRRGRSDCDVRVSESEWGVLQREHEKLRKDMEKAREETVALQERLNKSMSKEMRLRKQLDALERREADAIAVEERDIEEQEKEEQEWVLEPEAAGTDLHLNPFTWSSLDGIPDDFWDLPTAVTS